MIALYPSLLLTFLGYLFLVVAYIFKKPILTLFSAMFLLVLSIDILINGMVDLNNFGILVLGATTFGIGAYCSARTSLELIEE